jgi:D-alanyl-D-alanine carboxypeptidase
MSTRDLECVVTYHYDATSRNEAGEQLPEILVESVNAHLRYVSWEPTRSMTKSRTRRVCSAVKSIQVLAHNDRAETQLGAHLG